MAGNSVPEKCSKMFESTEIKKVCRIPRSESICCSIAIRLELPWKLIQTFHLAMGIVAIGTSTKRRFFWILLSLLTRAIYYFDLNLLSLARSSLFSRQESRVNELRIHLVPGLVFQLRNHHSTSLISRDYILLRFIHVSQHYRQW